MNGGWPALDHVESLLESQTELRLKAEADLTRLREQVEVTIGEIRAEAWATSDYQTRDALEKTAGRLQAALDGRRNG